LPFLASPARAAASPAECRKNVRGEPALAHKGKSREAPCLRTRDPTTSLTQVEVKVI
jgi:hypothetical protein